MAATGTICFSALQRAENSSIAGLGQRRRHQPDAVSVLFSEPKIPQLFTGDGDAVDVESFSALQRAENSSIDVAGERARVAAVFQCSSASRKFLNAILRFGCTRPVSVSVLFSEPKIPQCSSLTPHRQRGCAFQCSSASRKFLNGNTADVDRCRRRVSVLFSEPKIPQFSSPKSRAAGRPVSVLFSEPKIPQWS